MKLRKALLTAAAPDQRGLPLQTLVDRDGQTKTALRILLEELQAAGIEQVGIIVHPGDEERYATAAGLEPEQLRCIPQTGARGYGAALWAGRDFAGEDPVLHLVSDHLPVGTETGACARRLAETYAEFVCPISAVQATRETMLPQFGAVSGPKLGGRPGLYEIQRVAEKPTPTFAEQELLVPGLRAGHYLCFFGMHVLTPTLLDELGAHLEGRDRHPDLSAALSAHCKQARYLACEIPGERYNIGSKYGLLQAQLALSLGGIDREEVLALLLEVLAQRQRQPGDSQA